jgi:tRNA pseudouridine38-40 synthase
MTEKRKIKLTLSYDGSNYHGWQRQKNGLTIQEILEQKIGMMSGESITVIGSGRTDAGVHAQGQVCHFVTQSTIPVEAFSRGLNSLLPDDIRILKAEQVSEDFHARYSARSKVYEYRILNREEPDVFLRSYAWHIPRPLALAPMLKSLEMIRGEHDFSSFRSTGSSNRNPVRKIIRTEIRSSGKDTLAVVLEADGFLRHMVRNIVGTLVDVGLGKLSESGFLNILEARDRKEAGIKAPPGGLFLMSVNYGEG